MKHARRNLLVAVASTVLVAVLVMAIAERPSPGPVSSVHAGLERIDGGESCAACHGGLFGDMRSACSECHEDVAAQLEAGDGLHGRLDVALVGNCSTCHSEHHGGGFRLVNRLAFAQAGVADPAAFDHHLVGYEMAGKHLELQCVECHAHADDVLLARQRGAPVKAVFVHLDYVPYDLVYHKNPAVKSITDLQGRPFAVSLGFAYWEWLKKHFQLKPGREMPVTGDLSLFRNDPQMVQQGLSLYLPARMKGAGIEVDQFKVAQLGYRPYYVLFTTDEMIQKNPQVVKATVAAVQKGWAAFMARPDAIKPYLLGLNQQITSDVYDSAVRDMADGMVPKDAGKIGCMNDARWKELAEQLRSVNFLPAGFDEKQANDRSFVPGC